MRTTLILVALVLFIAFGVFMEAQTPAQAPTTSIDWNDTVLNLDDLDDPVDRNTGGIYSYEVLHFDLGGSIVLAFHADGTVSYPGTPDEATQAFFDVLEKVYPSLLTDACKERP